MILLLLSFLAPAAMGFAAVSILRPARGPIVPCLLLRACLGAGLGFGMCSCGFFVWSAVFGRPGGGFIIVETLLAAGTVALYVVLHRARSRSERPTEPAPGTLLGPWARRALLAAVLVSLVLAVGVFILATLQWPHGRADAWTIWNHRARFIFRSGERWTDAFNALPVVVHPGYPLLVPATIARSWVYVGAETLLAPALVAMFFAFATVGVAFSSLSAVRGRSQALIGTLVLLCTPFFFVHGATQCADVPLAFFILAAVVLLYLHDRSPESRRGPLVLAGLSAGFAAWTKNEGLVFVAAVCVARLAVAARTRRWRGHLREMLFFAAGLLPVLVVVACFKMFFAPRGLWLSAGFQSAIAGVADPARWYLIAKAFARKAVSFGRWRVSLSIVLVVYLGLLGLKVKEKDKRGVAASLATLCLLAAGYFLAYLTTPCDVSWHLTYSLNRLILQLWPSLVFVFFLVVRTPEEAVARRRGSPEAGGEDSPSTQNA